MFPSFFSMLMDGHVDAVGHVYCEDESQSNGGSYQSETVNLKKKKKKKQTTDARSILEQLERFGTKWTSFMSGLCE